MMPLVRKRQMTGIVKPRKSISEMVGPRVTSAERGQLPTPDLADFRTLLHALARCMAE